MEGNKEIDKSSFEFINDKTEIKEVPEEVEEQPEKVISVNDEQEEEETNEISKEEEEQLDKLDNELENTEVEEDRDFNVFNMDVLKEVQKNPQIILKSENAKEFLELNKEIQHDLSPIEEIDSKVHHGFLSSYSFGQEEFIRLTNLLGRLDQVAERVLTYRKSEMQYFPEFYAITKNLFINIKWLLDSNNRHRITEALNFVKISVIEYTTKGEMNIKAVMMLEETYALIMNLKNFHGLGVSYEKKRGTGEKYFDKLFGSKTQR